MKFNCPECKAAYNIPDEEFSRPLIKATCRKCGTKIFIDRDSGQVRAVSESTIPSSEEPKTHFPHLKTEITSHSISQTKDQNSKVKPHKNMHSVISLSPEYPKYRDVVIICCVVLILIAFVGGGYLLTRHTLKKVENVVEDAVNKYYQKKNNIVGIKDSKKAEISERPLNYVVDLAGIVDDVTENRLNGYLQQLEQKTTAQLVILTIKSLGGESIEDFSIKIAHDKWKLGQKGKDNGVLFLISLNDRKFRIEVGYGLEGVLPDSLVGSLARDILVPFFRKGDYSNGIFDTTLAMANEIATDSGVKIEGMPIIKHRIRREE